MAYVVNGQNVEAVRLTDAAGIWASPMPEGLHIVGALVATDSLVFTSRGGHTIALRRATGEKVWSYAGGGRLAIGPEGVLFIASRDGSLAAVTLHR
jgi:outer membrane protein assembly factor BamB